MMRIVLSCLCLAGLVSTSALGQDYTCVGVADGNLARVNCNGYTKCKNQAVHEVLTCKKGEVLERDTLTCKPIGRGNTICGTSGECSGTGYLPSPNCQSFFYCQNGKYYANSHQYCNAGFLFDGLICNYPYNAPETCGSSCS